MFFNPIGGIRYHLRAFRFRETEWKPFRESVGRWLEKWNPPERELILIGASGGYCVDFSFMKRFTKVTCVDPDPMAELIFRWRWNRSFDKPPQLFWCQENFFGEESKSFSSESFRAFLAARPGAAILFSNFLGQLRFLFDDEKEEAKALEFWKSELLKCLQGRSWASFHDRISGNVMPTQEAFVSPERLSDQALLDQFYSGGGELMDHLMDGFFPATLEHSYFPWKITPETCQLVEAVCSV